MLYIINNKVTRGSLSLNACFFSSSSFLSSSYHLLKPNNYVTTTIIYVIPSIVIIIIIISITVIIEKSSGGDSKQGIRVTWPNPIDHVKWWISRFKIVYRGFTASGAGLSLMLLKSFRLFCNFTRNSVVGYCGCSISASIFY